MASDVRTSARSIFAMKSTFKFKHTTLRDTWDTQPNTTVTVKTDAVVLDEVREVFDQFMKGCGFIFKTEDEEQSDLAEYRQKAFEDSDLLECVENLDKRHTKKSQKLTKKRKVKKL